MQQGGGGVHRGVTARKSFVFGWRVIGESADIRKTG
jgi:hypothetical protein